MGEKLLTLVTQGLSFYKKSSVKKFVNRFVNMFVNKFVNKTANIFVNEVYLYGASFHRKLLYKEIFF